MYVFNGFYFKIYNSCGSICDYKLWSIFLHSLLSSFLQTLTPSDSKQMAQHQLLSPAN